MNCKESKVAVIMCTFRRLDILPKTLDLLKNQTDTDFDLYIWNNNQEVRDLQPLNAKNHYPFRIECHHSSYNTGGIGRFYQCQKISDEYEYAIFIDDDQRFDPFLIETLKKEAKPKVISGWWAYKIWGNYNQRTRCHSRQEADYIGTGGMVCPMEIFKNEGLFRDIPEEYIFIEDLWLSFFARYECGYKLQKSEVNMSFFPQEEKRNQYQKLRKSKVEFHKYLMKNMIKNKNSGISN